MTKTNKKKLFGLLISLVIAAISYLLNQKTAPPAVLGTVAPGYYRVREVADGDTISVDMNGQTERIRMIGVDTPETHDPRKPVQCFGQAASDFTKNLIGNNPVRLESDEQSQNRDRYNRLLRYVYIPDGRLVQEEIIREGYGFAYTSFPFTKSGLFRQLENEARESNRGLWGNCQLTPNDFGGFTPAPE
jgi:micrococcal nuclease